MLPESIVAKAAAVLKSRCRRAARTPQTLLLTVRPPEAHGPQDVSTNALVTLGPAVPNPLVQAGWVVLPTNKWRFNEKVKVGSG